MKTCLYRCIFLALAVFAGASFFSACTKTHVKPHNVIPDSTIRKNDSIAKADTLPTFSSPTGLALDAAGNIYVADYGNNLIRKISTTGMVSTFAGNGSEGSINATGLFASFNKPLGIALDASGNLYVADEGNNQIRGITQAGVVTTIAGRDSTGFEDGQADSALFFAPTAVVTDGHGNIYVADAGNNLIRKITSAGIVSTLAGLDTTGTAPDFNNPTGLAVDASGNIFVANNINNNILKVTSAGVVSAFAGSGQQGATNANGILASFYFPENVVLDAAGNVYVSDGINNLIRKITPAGDVTTLAGSGVAGAIDSTGTAASFNGPAGLAVDAAGNVYVADSNNNLIRKITPAGVVTTIAGNGEAGARNGIAVAHKNTKPLKGISATNKLKSIYKVLGKPMLRNRRQHP